MPGAAILIKELNKTIITSSNDIFSINVPTGTYSLTVTYVSYTTLALNEVMVKSSDNAPLTIAMKVEPVR